MELINQYKGLRKEIYILFLGRIVTNMGSMIWPVMTLILNQKLGMDASGVALVTIISGIVVIPASFIGGKLADKYNKKLIIVYSDIVSIVFYIICGILPLSLFSIGLMIFAGSLQTLEDPAYTALIADLTPTKDREKAYSLSYLGGNIGLVASPAIAGLLFKNYLWLSFFIAGFAISISTILIFFRINDITPIEESTEEAAYQETRDDVSLYTILKESKSVFLFVIVSALYWAAYGQYGYLMPLDLGRIHGENGAALYGTVASLNCIVVVIFTPILTTLLVKISQTGKNLLGQILLLAGYMVFLIFLGHIPMYYVAMTLFTFGEILSTLACGPYLSTRVPASHRGRINGFSTTLHNILYGVVMMFIGRFYDLHGNVFAWTFMFILLGVTILGSAIIMILDRKEFPDLYK